MVSTSTLDGLPVSACFDSLGILDFCGGVGDCAATGWLLGMSVATLPTAAAFKKLRRSIEDFSFFGLMPLWCQLTSTGIPGAASNPYSPALY